MTDGRLRRGDLVRVRSAEAILATLDENGGIDGMPFMPEMVSYCGRRLVVSARTDKLCDTITADMTSRYLANCVILEDNRCDGAAHSGCQADCTIYWNEAWLTKVTDPAAQDEPAPSADDPATEALMARAQKAAVVSDVPLTYKCQATEMVKATTRLSTFDPRPYAREYRSGNVPAGRFIRVMGRAAVRQPLHSVGLLKNPPVRGDNPKTPETEPLNLQAGELVRVKSSDEIQKTLNDQGRNRGLWFDKEMLAYCGGVFRVKDRVVRVVDERTGHVLELGRDCIALEGVYCEADYSVGRWFCPRRIPPFWRECWLERVDQTAHQRG